MAEETSHQKNMRYSLICMIALLALANIFHILAWRERVEIRHIQANRGELWQMLLESKKSIEI